MSDLDRMRPETIAGFVRTMTRAADAYRKEKPGANDREVFLEAIAATYPGPLGRELATRYWQEITGTVALTWAQMMATGGQR